MPSATLVHSFPVPLGRRGSAAAAVIALHALLIAALITGIVVQIPRADITLPPPRAVTPPKRIEAPVVRTPIPVKDPWLIQGPPTTIEPPAIPPVTGTPVAIVAPEIVTVQPPPSGPTTAVRVLRMEEPPYPAAARRLGEEGVVLVRVLVGVDGRAERVELASSSGSSRLDEAALVSVRRWLFKPAASGAGPVASWTTLRVVFRLTG